MKKQERHQIKQHDLATLVERVSIYIQDNLRTVLLVAGAVVLAVLSLFAARNWMIEREAEASMMVGLLINAYNAPVIVSLDQLQQAPSGVESFTSTQERDLKVLELGDTILEHHSTASATPKALFYKGLALANLQRSDEAIAAQEQVLREYPGDFLAPMAQYQIARLREAEGHPAEALNHYHALAEGSGAILPPEEGLLGVARCQEAMGRTEEALETYRRLLTEFPESEYVGEARDKVSELS